MGEPTQNPSGNQPHAEGEAGLRELAQRLAAQQVTRLYGTVGPEPEPQLFVGHIPPDFPVEVPLPEGSHVVGSVSGPTITTIYVDASQPVSQVLQFYREQLKQNGWTPADFPGMGHGGFMPSAGGRFGPPQLFCKGEDTPSLAINAHETASGATDVRILFNTHADNPSQSPCREQRRMHERRGAQMRDIFPSLTPPAGAQQHSEGGGGGGDRWQTSAVLQGDVLLPEARAHYEGQLQDAGWTRTESGEGGAVAWSRWTFTDQEQELWRGTLLMLQQSEAPRSYYLLLRAEAANRQPGAGPGGFLSVPLASAGQSATLDIIGPSGGRPAPSGEPAQPGEQGAKGPSEGSEQKTGTEGADGEHA